LAALMGRAAVFALPARYEPFGLAALEAALSGCALVLGDIPSLREVWGDAALFVPPDDHEALRAALASLIAGPSLRKDLGRRARERASAYTVEAMTGSTIAAYERLLRSSALGRSGEEAVTCA
jgi:glycogen(starch) synthase